MWMSALFDTKNFGFFEICGQVGTRGVEPVQIFCGQGWGPGGSIFHDFVVTSFMEDPLSKDARYNTAKTGVNQDHEIVVFVKIAFLTLSAKELRNFLLDLNLENVSHYFLLSFFFCLH